MGRHDPFETCAPCLHIPFLRDLVKEMAELAGELHGAVRVISTLGIRSFVMSIYVLLAIGLVGMVFVLNVQAKHRRRVKSSGAVDPLSVKTGEDYADEYLTFAGNETRAKEIPAWALLFHSLTKPQENPTSWIGGTPKAPADFIWPLAPNGTRQHFLAQIDLSALSDTPNHGLPSDGALLIFFSYVWTGDAPDHVYSCHLLPAQDMLEAIDLAAPDDLAPLDQHMQFFTSEKTFTKRSVELVPFLDDGSSPPTQVPFIFDRPDLWITNWGLAAAEADATLLHLERAVARWTGAAGEKRLADVQKRHADFPTLVHAKRTLDTALALRETGPDLIKALTAWRDLARTRPATAAVDVPALRAIFAERAAFSRRIEGNPKNRLKEGAHEDLWNTIRHHLPGIAGDQVMEPALSFYRDFVEQKVTNWRGHRLFGIEPPFENNGEDLRGLDCLISIRGDDLLGSQCEHFYGVSIWCPSGDLSKGKLDGGTVVRHCAV